MNGQPWQNERQLRQQRKSDRTEHDAVNLRFLERSQATKVHCLSCNGHFERETIVDVIKHYAEQPHPQFHSSCLYCNGHVHRYQDGAEIKVYHDCYRSTQRLDQ